MYERPWCPTIILTQLVSCDLPDDKYYFVLKLHVPSVISLSRVMQETPFCGLDMISICLIKMRTPTSLNQICRF